MGNGRERFRPGGIDPRRQRSDVGDPARERLPHDLDKRLAEPSYADLVRRRLGEANVELDEVNLDLRTRLMQGKPAPGGFSLERPAAVLDAVKDPIGEWRVAPPLWRLECDNDQTHRLVAAGAAAGGTVTGAASLIPGIGQAAAVAIGLKIAGTLSYIEFVNSLGGNHGVVITGVIGAEGLIIVPRGLALPFATLADAAGLAVAGRTILEWVIAATSYAPVLGQALTMTGLSVLFNAVTAGTPLGWALSLAVGWTWEQIFADDPDPNEHGHVLANRARAGPWEEFVLSREGDEVMLLSHVGLFSADGGGGGAVYANRVDAGPWERWTIVHHADGAVSFRTANGNHLVAEHGGGAECNANRRTIGSWEKFRLEYRPGEKVALRAAGGQYVSVQP